MLENIGENVDDDTINNTANHHNVNSTDDLFPNFNDNNLNMADDTDTSPFFT